MSKLNPLSKEEIEEELLNNDLICGGEENQRHLQQMNSDQKKNFSKGSIQSKEVVRCESSARTSNSPTLDISSTNFPSLPPVGNNSRNKLKLPRRTSSGPKAADSDNSFDKCISLLDDVDDEPTFILPFCVDDDGSPLAMPDRPLRRIKNPLYVKDGELPGVALNRMLQYHDAWEVQYHAEMHTREIQEDLKDSDSQEFQRDSLNDGYFEENQNDPYKFTESSIFDLKVQNSARKRETDLNSDISLQTSSRTLQRKTSRDSDCSEVEAILKPDIPKGNDWQLANSIRTKRNRKQQSNQGKSQTYEETANVEFQFDERWDPPSSTWASSNSGANTLNNQVTPRRNPPMTTVVEEEKVQCPICLVHFARSKVEAHAAVCEPMEVEESQD